MPRYLIVEFEHDDEFGLFPDDLQLMLAGHSNPPFSVEVIGEAKPVSPFRGLWEVAPIDQ